ncbi:16527_t:CDS:1, partial [Racocetra fulgida]
DVTSIRRLQQVQETAPKYDNPKRNEAPTNNETENNDTKEQ